MMGGIPPSETLKLSLYDYTALRTIWNARHERPDGDDGEPVDPPDEDYVRAAQAELYELGIAGRELN